jgi:hypothetical protein
MQAVMETELTSNPLGYNDGCDYHVWESLLRNTAWNMDAVANTQQCIDEFEQFQTETTTWYQLKLATGGACGLA